MKLDCNECEGIGELVPEREGAEYKKTGKHLPATDDNLRLHCRGGGDLAECDICEGRGYIVTQSEAAKYLMSEVKKAVGLVNKIANLSPPELNSQLPYIRILAIHISEQIGTVSKEIIKERDSC